MSAADLVLRGRLMAERLMLSTCTITRPGGPAVWNETTGTYTDPEPLVVYTGRCKVQDNGRSVGNADAGEQQVGVNSLELHLPVVGSESVAAKDRAHIDANPLDPGLVGTVYIVQGPHAATLKTARRLPIEEVV